MIKDNFYKKAYYIPRCKQEHYTVASKTGRKGAMSVDTMRVVMTYPPLMALYEKNNKGGLDLVKVTDSPSEAGDFVLGSKWYIGASINA